MNEQLEFAIEKAKASIEGMENGTMTYKQADIIAKNARTIVYGVATDLRERMFVAASESGAAISQQFAPRPVQLTRER